MPREYQNSSGQIVLDYAKAIQESIFEQLRVVRDGQLRIVFSPDLKVNMNTLVLFSMNLFFFKKKWLHIRCYGFKHTIYSLFHVPPHSRYALGSSVLDVMKSLSLEDC